MALGAYEAEVFKGPYKKIRKEDRTWKIHVGYIIIVGTSIGAVNPAVLVRNVKQNGTRGGSAEKWENFWMYQLSSQLPVYCQCMVLLT